jgi:hypothetical protein
MSIPTTVVPMAKDAHTPTHIRTVETLRDFGFTRPISTKIPATMAPVTFNIRKK